MSSHAVYRFLPFEVNPISNKLRNFRLRNRSRCRTLVPNLSLFKVARESFFYAETGKLLSILDEAARRSHVSRGQAFEDFLHMTVCSLSGGKMEGQYMRVVKKHSDGQKGKRGCDSLAQLFGEMVNAMEDTRGEMKDVLGDLFQGAITYGEAGQFLTPESITRLMAKLQTGDVEIEAGRRPTVCDPCCGSGRMLLAVAEENPHWEFIGQDVDLRCVRMTAINLFLLIIRPGGRIGGRRAGRLG